MLDLTTKPLMKDVLYLPFFMGVWSRPACGQNRLHISTLCSEAISLKVSVDEIVLKMLIKKNGEEKDIEDKVNMKSYQKGNLWILSIS